MGNSLSIIAIVLVIFWAIAFFEYGVGGIVHFLLVLAAIVLAVKFFRGRKVI